MNRLRLSPRVSPRSQGPAGASGSVGSRTARWSCGGLFLVLVTACASPDPTPDIAATVDASVAATVAARTPPTPTPLATPTLTTDRYPYLHPLAHLVQVEGIVTDPDSGSPIVLLRSVDDDRYLPIWIGALEAIRIAAEMQGIPVDRPLPQHLLGSAISELGAQVRYVVITRLDQGTYYAHVVLDQQGGTLELDARPSDAIALALAVRAPIYAERRVLEMGGFIPPTPEAATDGN